MAKLAILGGKPVRRKKFPFYKTVGSEEKLAVGRVIDSGILSNFLGSWHPNFYGGKEVQSLEKEWAEYFGVKYAIAVNSCTSGLYCAVGAIGVEPGDEIIVSPYTMSASATAPLIFNAIPVFADIEEEYFCLDSEAVEKVISSKTRAIIVVDIFGQPYDVKKINRIAKKYGLYIIEDCAQAPYAKYKNKFAGTLADIGVFSLNCHKHIQCGEGGIVVTNNRKLAERIRLIRNHAEAVVKDRRIKDISNMIGFNFRMTELEAAVARCQLKKLDRFVKQRVKNCNYIYSQLKDISAIKIPPVREGCSHVYYIQPFKFNEEIAGISRDVFIKAVQAELTVTEKIENYGVKIWAGYCKPLYLLPLYQRKIAYGKKGFP
ncbi:MAG: DegT/DnrJ/EryC1/StrS family aminotransferase, partial [Spirochaetes bacterium]